MHLLIAFNNPVFFITLSLIAFNSGQTTDTFFFFTAGPPYNNNKLKAQIN